MRKSYLLTLLILCAAIVATLTAVADRKQAFDSDVYSLQSADVVVEGVVQRVDAEALKVPLYVMADPKAGIQPGQGNPTKFDIYEIRVERVLKGYYPRDVLVVAALSTVPTSSHGLSEPSPTQRTQIVTGIKSHALTRENDRLVVCVDAWPFVRTETGRFLHKDRSLAWPLVFDDDGQFVFRNEASNRQGFFEFPSTGYVAVAPDAVPSSGQLAPIFVVKGDAGWFTLTNGRWISLETAKSYASADIDGVLQEVSLERVREEADVFVQGIVRSKPERTTQHLSDSRERAYLSAFEMEVEDWVPLSGGIVLEKGQRIRIQSKQGGLFIPEWARGFSMFMVVPEPGERWQGFLKLRSDGFYCPFAGGNGFFRVDHALGERLVYMNRVALPFSPTRLLNSLKDGLPIEE